jgi:hypothetical protein
LSQVERHDLVKVMFLRFQSFDMYDFPHEADLQHLADCIRKLRDDVGAELKIA